MKKAIALLLVLVMALSLAACFSFGKKPTKKPGKQDTSSQAQSEAEQASQPENTPDSTEPQEAASSEDNEATVNPDEDGVLVSWGGVLKYDPEKWEKTNLGLKAKDSEAKIVFTAYGYTVDEMVQNREMNAQDIATEDITVNGNNAKKVVYTSGWSPNLTTMAVVIDTAFTKSELSKVFVIELSVKKETAEVELLDDPTIWEMINSFYYDEKALK